MIIQSNEYNVWILLQRARAVPGQWVAHCLEFDVVSQGESIEHALDMVMEAVILVAGDDLQQGRDPRERRAPQQYFDELLEISERSVIVPAGIPAPQDQAVERAALQVHVTIDVRAPALVEVRPVGQRWVSTAHAA